MPGLPSILAPGLDLVLCGTAVGEQSAARGHYYAGRGNQFWRLLHDSGLTPTLLTPEDDRRLPEYGIGLTDLAPGITQSHDRGLRYDIAALTTTITAHAPRVLAFTSLTGGRAAARAFGAGKVGLGQQDWTIGPAQVWVLPSSSGANNAAPYAEKLAAWRALAQELGR